MIAVYLIIGLTILSGCASTKQHWYEHPGIILGGAGFGAVVGPENISILEAERRYRVAHPHAYGDAFTPLYFVGFGLHAGTAISLGILVPPAAFAYLGVCTIAGIGQFTRWGGWEWEYKDD